MSWANFILYILLIFCSSGTLEIKSWKKIIRIRVGNSFRYISSEVFIQLIFRQDEKKIYIGKEDIEENKGKNQLRIINVSLILVNMLIGVGLAVYLKMRILKKEK